jgi:hypothetical protein
MTEMNSRFAIACAALMLVVGTVRAAELFEPAARVLERHCLRCHIGADPKGDLSLTTRRQAVEGGESGPALVPGSPDDSLLIQYVTGDEPLMPKEGEPLDAEEVAALRAWIEAGAEWPDERVLIDQRFEGSKWWSLAPLQRPTPPTASDWVRTPIDAFILARMNEEGLAPSPAADRPTLIRRLSFDLIGLPPTPDEVDAFVNDPAPDAYERLVDRLLASPRYGERWGRHWLDVVHFGETHGYDKDKTRPNAWPYRDYVIQSLNADKPYGRFVEEQLAGDVLWPDDPNAVVATGFIAAGPWDFVGHAELREGTVAKEVTRSLDRDDMVMTAMSTFLSVTAHCARCHDHKFDPISQCDYYALQSVFAGVERGDRPYRKLAQQDDPAPEKTEKSAAAPAEPLVYAVKPIPPRPIHLLARGDVTQPQELMQPGALRCLEGLEATFEPEPSTGEGAGRAAFARWVTHSKNGLFRRSIVNRVWQFHFGQGLCSTPNDFGRMGTVPTHPELLDWLAAEFAESGESLKKLHALIVTSAVYRQSSAANPQFETIDATGRYLWRFPRRRLDAEALRDAMLAVSGKLDLKMGGPSDQQFFFKDDHSPIYDYERFAAEDAANYRRSVYRFLVRSVPDPFMECLDCADPSQLVAQRNTTITALQALTMLNNKLVLRLSHEYADRLKAHSPELVEQIAVAFKLAYAREPSEQEIALLSEYVPKHGLVNLCRVIFNSNEFVFVD